MTEKVTLTVSGMKCGGCENNISTSLLALDGVNEVSASHKDDEVTVEYDSEMVDLEAIEKAITDAGFTVE